MRFHLQRSTTVQLAVFLHDALAAGIAFLLAISTRYGLFDFAEFWTSTLLFVVVGSATGYVFGLNGGVWRYASLADLSAIVKTATASLVVFVLILFFITRLDAIPRSSLLPMWAFHIVLLGGSRVAYRIMRNQRVRRHSAERNAIRSVLVVGVGPQAENFIKASSERSDLPYQVLGLIDLRGRRKGMSIRGVKVLGDVHQLVSIVSAMKTHDTPVDSIVITNDSLATAGIFEEVARTAKANHLELLHLPGVRTLDQQGPGDTPQFPRPIALDDLLARRGVVLDTSRLVEMVQGATVLVTGAGGSIGSELCRQLYALGPKRLVLVELSEFALYSIDSELRRLKGGVEIVARIGNVREADRILELFREQRPNVVFHAAALKHVPIVEAQPLEGVSTNVLGTRNVADAALAVAARAMILISTDKAVNPTNVMGATKRIAEMYCQSLDMCGSTRFVTVRFGNVLGSAGSVVPLFEQQIRAGGPVTVTHPDIERYFMTIPEAVMLVLQAAWLGMSGREDERGRIFVLDMGKPVRIADVARNMIRLAGFEPDVDIKVEYIGLRPGEKLFEELFDRREALVATDVEGLLSASPRPAYSRSEIAALLEEVARYIEAGSHAAALEFVRRVVPEYVSDIRLQPVKPTALPNSTVQGTVRAAKSA